MRKVLTLLTFLLIFQLIGVERVFAEPAGSSSAGAGTGAEYVPPERPAPRREEGGVVGGNDYRIYVYDTAVIYNNGGYGSGTDASACHAEEYLRDENGNLIRDEETGHYIAVRYLTDESIRRIIADNEDVFEDGDARDLETLMLRLGIDNYEDFERTFRDRVDANGVPYGVSRRDWRMAVGVPTAGTLNYYDTTYSEIELSGENEVAASKAPIPLVHRRTIKMTPLHLNPWYLVNLQRKKGIVSRYTRVIRDGHWESVADVVEEGPYMGPIYRGDRNKYRLANRLVQIDRRETVNGCNPLIVPAYVREGEVPREAYYDPVWLRMELDACANQYILNRSRQVRVGSETQSRIPYIARRIEEMRESTGGRVALEEQAFCQPFRQIPVMPEEQEYVPSDYILYAWAKLLYNSDFVVTGAEAEPNYSSNGVYIPYRNRIQPPTNGFAYLRWINDSLGITDGSIYNFGVICENDIAEKQVERILDPSHPFSPRWHFETNERDYYSPMTSVYGGDENNVRCTGSRDNVIKTDIMEWRWAEFDTVIMTRIRMNIACYVMSRTTPFDCWEVLGCSSNTDANPSGECCTTAWNGTDIFDMNTALDLSTGERVTGGAAGDNSWITDRNNAGAQLLQMLCGDPIEEACAEITKPVVPLNPLKLVANESESVPNYNEELLPEGYSFNHYFGRNRPYMRCWDTGMECGLLYEGDGEDDPHHDEGVLTEEGHNYAAGASYHIAGVGRAYVGVNTPVKERCLIGGGLGMQSEINPGVRFNGDASNSYADPITSWAELKLYQARSVREFGLNCLVKHETLFKLGTGEEIILSRSGGQYQRAVYDDYGNLTRLKTFSWPMSWRGYVGDPIDETRFPNFNSDGEVELGRGISDAMVGDVLIFDHEVLNEGVPAGQWRNPYVAYVTEKTRLDNGIEFVSVLAYNHGKYLDACGNTDSWFMGEEFAIYNGRLPIGVMETLEEYGYGEELGIVGRAVNSEHLRNALGVGESYSPSIDRSCDDPMMSACIEPMWDRVKRYHPASDLRIIDRDIPSD